MVEMTVNLLGAFLRRFSPRRSLYPYDLSLSIFGHSKGLDGISRGPSGSCSYNITLLTPPQSAPLVVNQPIAIAYLHQLRSSW